MSSVIRLESINSRKERPLQRRSAVDRSPTHHTPLDIHTHRTHRDRLGCVSDIGASQKTPMDRFDVLHKIGEGGQGVVALVRRKVDRMILVAKDAHISRLDPNASRVASEEGERLRDLRHPHIITHIEHFFESGGSFFIITEHAEGGTLAAVIKQYSDATPMPEADILRYFVQIAYALDYLHSRGFIHRDIKSNNVFLTRHGDVKVGDVGLSTILTATHPKVESFCGTHVYVAPEMYRSEPYGTKIDVWSLGVVLFEMMTQRLPFTGANFTLEQSVVHQDYPDVSGTCYSASLKEILRRCLLKDPQHRPDIATLLRSEVLIQACITPHSVSSPISGLLQTHEQQMEVQRQQHQRELTAQRQRDKDEITSLRNEMTALQLRLTTQQTESASQQTSLRNEITSLRNEITSLRQEVLRLSASPVTPHPTTSSPTLPPPPPAVTAPTKTARHPPHGTLPPTTPTLDDLRRLDVPVVAGRVATERHTSHITSVAVVRVEDSFHVASCSEDGTIKLWNIENGGVHVRTVEVGSGVWAMCTFGGDDGRVACGCSDHTVRVHHMRDGSSQCTLRGHRNWVQCVVWTGTLLVSGGDDQTIRFWDVDAGVLHRTIDDAHNNWVQCLLSPSPDVVVSGGADLLIKVWRVSDGCHVSTLRGHRNTVSCMVMYGESLISGSRDGSITQWDVASAQCVHTVDKAHDGKEVLALCIFGPYIVSSGYKHNVLHVWDVPTWTSVRSIEIPNFHTANSVTCLTSFGRMLVGGQEGDSDHPPSLLMWGVV